MPTTTILIALILLGLIAFFVRAYLAAGKDGPTQRSARAKVIAHSAYAGGPAIATVQAVVQRFVLAELNTHRAVNKNSASSRAIPFKKQLRKILTDLAYPETFPAEQKGMQGGGPVQRQRLARAIWWMASRLAVAAAWTLAKLGVHKSVVNRILEPFMWHTVVLTGTAWENFFDQRCHPDAQPEIRVMAEAIRTAIQNSGPTELEPGEWHLPYVDEETRGDIAEYIDLKASVAELDGYGKQDYEKLGWATATKVSAARCARVSYLTQEGKRDIEADLALYNRLTLRQQQVIAEHVTPIHWSPLEHVATPWPENRHGVGELSFPSMDGTELHLPDTDLPIIGNLLGWRSLRVQEEARMRVVTYR